MKDKMRFSVKLSDDEKYILCSVTGEFTAAEAQEFTLEIDTVSRESGCKKFLIDLQDAKNISNVFENYDFAYKDMSRHNFQHDARVAILVSPQDHSNDFVETVISNAGYSVRVCCDNSDAIAWLEE